MLMIGAWTLSNAPPLPEQLEQAMVVARNQDRDFLADVAIREPEGHPKPVGDVTRERCLHILRVGCVQRVLDPHEEGSRLGVGRVLRSVENVRAPRSYKNDETVATIPGRSGQLMSRRDTLMSATHPIVRRQA